MSMRTEIDCAMEVMLRAFPGTAWTLKEIAEVTGLTRSGVYMAEKSALRHLVEKLERAGICRAHQVDMRRNRKR